MSSFFNSIFKANPHVCLHLSVSISPHLAVLKEFWNLITLFCTRAIRKFSKPMDFSWRNTNLFKPKLFCENATSTASFSTDTFQTQEGAPAGETHPIHPTSSQAVSAQAWVRGDLALSSGTEQEARWSHIQSITWATELSAVSGTFWTRLPSLPPPLISPAKKSLLLLESTTQRKPDISFLLALKRTQDAQQAVTISFPQSLQHSQPQPATRTVAFLSCNWVPRRSSTTKSLEVKGWFSFISEQTCCLALLFCYKAGAVLSCWVVV